MSYLVAAEDAAGAEGLIAALALEGTVEAVTFSTASAGQMAAAGIPIVHLLECDHLARHGLAVELADVARERHAELVVLPDTTVFRDLAAAVAALLDVGLVTSATGVSRTDGAVETSRTGYAGAVVRRERTSLPAVLTVAPAPAPTGVGVAFSGAQGAVLERSVPVDEGLHVERETTGHNSGADTRSLASARRVVGVGLGFASIDELQPVERLAELLDAGVGCTRPVADDRRWLPGDTYIGISGARLTADLYLALGVSGQSQHMVGVRDVRCVVAVNRDPNAPVFDGADYGVVGDVNEVVRELISAMERRRGA